jgi:ribonuclease T2
MRLSRSVVATGCAFAIAISSLMGATEAEARRNKRNRPGDFDFYLMALSIAPSFCTLTGSAQHKRQCEDPSDADYRTTPLTVHGLWPNKKNRSANQQPSSCSTEELSLSPGLRQKLRVYMPGTADGLDRHEWEKHGVCSGLSPEEYFGKVVAIAEKANATIGAVLKEKRLLGREVPVETLLQGVAEKNRALAKSIVVDCKFPRRRGSGPGGQSRAYVAEIRVLISKDVTSDPDRDGWPGTFVPLGEVGFRANSGCPGGAGFIPGGFGA